MILQSLHDWRPLKRYNGLWVLIHTGTRKLLWKGKTFEGAMRWLKKHPQGKQKPLVSKVDTRYRI